MHEASRDDPGLVAGRRVLMIAGGTTLTHGGMKLGTPG
jgi:predicted GTPase